MRREFGPDDETALTTTVDELVRGFEDTVGYDGWVAHQLLHLRWAYLDGRLLHWQQEDLAELLLEVFPRKVLVEDDDVGGVVPAARAFLRWLHDTHGLTGDPLPRLLHLLDRIAPEVEAGLRDSTRFGPAKALAAMMGQTGVDMGDADAVQAFMESFNARPFEERQALLPMPGDPGTSPFDGLPPLPPVRPLPAHELAAAVADAPLYGWVTGLVEAIGTGRPLTKKGNLRLADGREIVDRLGLEDVAWREELGSPVRSTADLPDLDLTFRVARAAGFVKVQHGKVLPTKRAGDLRAAPDRAWPRVVDGLLDVGILAHRYANQQYMVPPWIDRLDDSVDGLLLSLLMARGPVPIEDLAGAARDDLSSVWQIPEGDAEGGSWWRRVPEDNVRHLLRRLADAGVVALSDVEVVPREHWGHDEHGGAVELTAAGALIASEAAREAGVSVDEAGRLRDAPAGQLLTELAEADGPEVEAEVQVWVWDRDPAAALGELVDAVLEGLPMAAVPAAATAVITCASIVGADEGHADLQRLVDHRLLGPVVGGWLVGQGVADVPRRDPLDGLISLAAVGAPDEAVVVLQESGSSRDQQEMLDAARADAGQDAIPLLQAVADLHDDKAVAKAARKALFRLGVRR